MAKNRVFNLVRERGVRIVPIDGDIVRIGDHYYTVKKEGKAIVLIPDERRM